MASGTRSRVAAQACLLRLPDHCLLAVMQCCADDTSSALSAANSHSRLQEVAVEALGSISAEELDQARSNSLLLYLAKHGQHVRSLALRASCEDVQLRELPPSLTKLDSLQLEGLRLQLQPGLGGTKGVLRAGLPLTRLELSDCRLLDEAQGLAAALMQLPDLQHLSVDMDAQTALAFPTDVLPHLQKLTSLRLQGVACRDRNSSSRDSSAALQPLQALTRLADLQLRAAGDVTTDTLSGADQLTRLVLSQQLFEPRALAGKTQLQHVTLNFCSLVPGADVVQLLSELQHLTQLTYLDLGDSCRWRGPLGGPSPPPAAYASLTASSRLQHLGLRCSTLLLAAWRYMCPLGRTLAQLRYLDIRGVKEADRSFAQADTSALVSCCPGLQSLMATGMGCSTAQLASLQRLTGLHTLVVGGGHDDDFGVQALCQLTGLQELDLLPVQLARGLEARLMQLTQLTRLTALTFPEGGAYHDLRCHSKDPGSEPVWHQLLWQLLDSHDPEVAQQAAAALEAA